jgi:hypothetical protein
MSLTPGFDADLSSLGDGLGSGISGFDFTRDRSPFLAPSARLLSQKARELAAQALKKKAHWSLSNFQLTGEFTQQAVQVFQTWPLQAVLVDVEADAVLFCSGMTERPRTWRLCGGPFWTLRSLWAGARSCSRADTRLPVSNWPKAEHTSRSWGRINLIRASANEIRMHRRAMVTRDLRVFVALKPVRAIPSTLSGTSFLATLSWALRVSEEGVRPW